MFFYIMFLFDDFCMVFILQMFWAFLFVIFLQMPKKLAKLKQTKIIENHKSLKKTLKTIQKPLNNHKILHNICIYIYSLIIFFPKKCLFIKTHWKHKKNIDFVFFLCFVFNVSLCFLITTKNMKLSLKKSLKNITKIKNKHLKIKWHH